MIPSIEERREALDKLCRKHHVRRLELFGSARDEAAFDDNGSDLDFLVDFLPLNPGEYADHYFGLLEALQELFRREVDLVTTRSIKNPYFLRSINSSREVIYAT